MVSADLQLGKTAAQPGVPGRMVWFSDSSLLIVQMLGIDET
jgi:hypothetical protein